MAKTTKNPIGRPRKYKTVKQLQKAIDAYFDRCKEEEEPLTITGLALALGFTQRKQLIDNEGYSGEFCNTIKRAKAVVERDYELSLRKNGRAGDIFGLKNFGWSDRQEVEHTGDLSINIIDYGANNDE